MIGTVVMEKGKLMTIKNIDTILVNPSEIEKVKKALLKNGLKKYADMIIPCEYIMNGRMLAYCTERTMYIDASWLKYWKETKN